MNLTDSQLSRQGNYCKKQEEIWEQEKIIGLAQAINKNPNWGREYIRNLELKKGKEFVLKIKEAANNEREKLLKRRQNTQFRR